MYREYSLLNKYSLQICLKKNSMISWGVRYSNYASNNVCNCSWFKSVLCIIDLSTWQPLYGISRHIKSEQLSIKMSPVTLGNYYSINGNKYVK